MGLLPTLGQEGCGCGVGEDAPALAGNPSRFQWKISAWVISRTVSRLTGTTPRARGRL